MERHVVSRRNMLGAAAASVASAAVAGAIAPSAFGSAADPKVDHQGLPKHLHRGPVLFQDDFDGPSVDRAKWNVNVTQSLQYNNELEAYVDRPGTVRIVSGREAQGATGSALLLQAHYRPGFVTPQGGKVDFLSGKLDSSDKFDTDHGTLSARMKLPAGLGYWPAFWMLGYGNWPDTGEIDIMENIGDPSWVSAATHGPGYSGDQAPVNRGYLPSMHLGDVTSWHTYTLDWTPTAMSFYVDGLLFFEETKPMITFFGTWAFDNPKYLILNLALGGIYPYKMSGIDSPYYGMDDRTFRSVQAGRGRTLVDWVLVTDNR
jgi:beta-glucanase (GH16 family)